MRRREFIALVGGSAVAWPFAVRAQRPGMPAIGFLGAGSLEPLRDQVAVLHRGLKETGFIEGQNVTIEYRWAEGQYDRLPRLAAELVQHQVTVIVTTGGRGASPLTLPKFPPAPLARVGCNLPSDNQPRILVLG